MLSNKLAIIIPAYKPDFLVEALDSLANQTCKSFKVYIGDDASPYDLASIIEPYKERLNLEYHRFDENVGGRSLIQQWERCIARSDEPWVWLFSDDDVADAGCVAEFYDTLKSTVAKYDLYRFNTVQIDEHGAVDKFNVKCPLVESSEEFLYYRLRGVRSCFAVEYIFRRKHYEECGGFVEFPVAWNSDVATWALMGRKYGIFTMQKPCVCWRLSGKNLSSANTALAKDKLDACIEFFRWIDTTFSECQSTMYTLLCRLRFDWIIGQCGSAGFKLLSKDLHYSVKEVAIFFGKPFFAVYRRVFLIFLNQYKRKLVMALRRVSAN